MTSGRSKFYQKAKNQNTKTEKAVYSPAVLNCQAPNAAREIFPLTICFCCFSSMALYIFQRRNAERTMFQNIQN